MEIFEFEHMQSKEKECVYAENVFAAMELYAMEHSVASESLDEDILIRKLKQEEWDTRKVHNDVYDENDSDPESDFSWQQKTFREFVAGVTTSLYICGTMNDIN